MTHTSCDSNSPWWRVAYNISQINIFNRTNCSSGRLNSAVVYVGNVESNNPADYTPIILPMIFASRRIQSVRFLSQRRLTQRVTTRDGVLSRVPRGSVAYSTAAGGPLQGLGECLLRLRGVPGNRHSYCDQLPELIEPLQSLLPDRRVVGGEPTGCPSTARSNSTHWANAYTQRKVE